MTKSGFPAMDSYKFIVQWALAHKGNTPSMKQIGDGLGIAPATAFYHVRSLVERGLLTKLDGDICITRLVVSAPDNIYQLEAPERAYPEINQMEVIPKQMTWGKKHPKEMGVATGDAIDDEFLMAVYPPYWHFAAISTINGACMYQLLDDGNVPRAVLNYDLVNYKASIHFWG